MKFDWGVYVWVFLWSANAGYVGVWYVEQDWVMLLINLLGLVGSSRELGRRLNILWREEDV